MRIRFLGSDTHTSYSRSGSRAFASNIAMGEERECPDEEGTYLLETFPLLFERVDEGKVEALDGPESDKQVKAPTRKKG